MEERRESFLWLFEMLLTRRKMWTEEQLYTVYLNILTIDYITVK